MAWWCHWLISPVVRRLSLGKGFVMLAGTGHNSLCVCVRARIVNAFLLPLPLYDLAPPLAPTGGSLVGKRAEQTIWSKAPAARSIPPVPVRLCQMRDNEAQPGAEESLEPKHTVAEPFAHRSFIIRWPRFMRCKPLGCELHRAMGESGKGITKGTSIDTSLSICRRRRRRVVIIFISNVVVRCVSSTLRHNVWGFHYEHEVSLCARMQFCR